MKKFWLIFGTIFCVLCVAIDVWAVCVYKFAPNKIVSNTYELDLLTTSDGSTKRSFIEINYYTNKKGNGLELFEIKYNYFMDEDRERIISVGSQYVADSITDSLDWSHKHYLTYKVIKDERYGFLHIGHRMVYDAYYKYKLKDNASYYEYQSANDYDFSMGNNINPMSGDTTFKVTIGDELYLLEFKKDVSLSEFYLATWTLRTPFSEDVTNQYPYVDHDFFAYKLYQSLQHVTYGTDNFELLQFADFFNYYKYDGNTYVKVEDTNNSKVKTEFNNYYIIKINVVEDGAVKASDSLFNIVAGDSTFNFTGGYIYEDYLYTKATIALTITDFNLIELEENKYGLALKREFVNAYKGYKNQIVLDIRLNLDDIDGQVVGFIQGQGLEDFEVQRVVTSYNGGYAVESEVHYA